ncbi:MAG: MerR family transcriptional regulator [Parasphingorhabdus sp.]|uniref:MerR family transcriptional regulator n=1 Tax=Parasphingorhabdus sp. TaxID=2709688 RepID=UPI003001D177
MTKDSGAFRTIGELSKELNIKPHILRYWEDQFGMLQPLKRAGSRRHYRPEDVEMVRTINRLLNEDGYTIKGARKFLASRNKQAAAPAAPEVSAPLAGTSSNENPSSKNDHGVLIRELKLVRDQLSNALSQA